MATHHLTLPVDVEAIRALRLGDLVTVDVATGGVVRPGTDADTPRTERDDRLALLRDDRLRE